MKDKSKIKCPSCGKWFIEDQFIKGCCPECGVRNPLFVNPKADECGNCHSYIGERDKFCRYCGFKVGEKFEPYLNIIECIYGPPPIETEHECKCCGNIWNSWSYYEEEQGNFCPSCGRKEII